MKTIRTALLAAIMLFPACAEAGDTLEKIKAAGEIAIGHRESSIPFSYYDGNQKPVGFLMDICGKITEAVKTELKMPTLQTKLQAIQMGNLIPLVENGTVDIVCGPTSNTIERQKVVAFSDTVFVATISAVVKKDSSIKNFEDLDGKPVALTSGSTSIGLLAGRAQEKKFQTRNVLSADHSNSFLTLTTGRTAAFVMDDILLASMIATSAKPDDWRIIADSLRSDPYGLVIRKDDPKFKALVDKTIVDMMQNGEFQRLYDKWFTSPIPPKNVNLNFPMTPALKEAVEHPNDKGV